MTKIIIKNKEPKEISKITKDIDNKLTEITTTEYENGVIVKEFKTMDEEPLYEANTSNIRVSSNPNGVDVDITFYNEE